MQDSYRTIKALSEGIFKEKGSKFLAFAWPVSNEDEIDDKLLFYKKKYHDARHHCYAYRLGIDRLIYKANDDNEPTYTAGKPILGQIDSFGLTNILIVVVRYFGGTLLGKGGLINAYKSAANDALSKAQIIERTVNDYFKINCSYEEAGKVLKALKEIGINPEEQVFDNECEIKVAIRVNNQPLLQKKLEHINSLKIKYLYTV